MKRKILIKITIIVSLILFSQSCGRIGDLYLDNKITTNETNSSNTQ